MLDRIKNKVLNMIARAVIDRIKVAQDGTVQATASVLADEVRDDMDVVQHYGFASVPIEGSEAVLIFVGGDRSSGVVIGTENADARPKNMKSGEVALYTDEGVVVYLKRGRAVEVNCGTLEASVDISAKISAPEVTIDSPSVSVTGNLSVGGQVSDGVGSLAQLRTQYLAHVHGGVMPGSSTTTPPKTP